MHASMHHACMHVACTHVMYVCTYAHANIFPELKTAETPAEMFCRKACKRQAWVTFKVYMLVAQLYNRVIYSCRREGPEARAPDYNLSGCSCPLWHCLPHGLRQVVWTQPAQLEPLRTKPLALDPMATNR